MAASDQIIRTGDSFSATYTFYQPYQNQTVIVKNGDGDILNDPVDLTGYDVKFVVGSARFDTALTPLLGKVQIALTPAQTSKLKRETTVSFLLLTVSGSQISRSQRVCRVLKRGEII